MEEILIVCTGNTCRSPMAEGILKHLIEKRELADKYIVKSAGIAAKPGDYPSESAVTVLKKLWNIDIHGHRSKMVTEKDMADAKLVLVMTRDHRMILAGRHSKYAKKIFTLKQFVDKKPATVDNTGRYDYSVDVPDPYGMPEMIYKRTAEEIYTYMERLIDML